MNKNQITCRRDRRLFLWLFIICFLVINGIAFQVSAAETDKDENNHFISFDGIIMDAWARQEVEQAGQTGLLGEGLLAELGTDLTRPITRQQFCQTVVQLIAVTKGITAEELMAESGFVSESEDLSDNEQEDLRDKEKKDLSDNEQDDQYGNEPVIQVPERVFSDTENPYVEFAHKLGIINGYNGLFHPDSFIIRSEAAVMLQRTMAVLGETDPSHIPQQFSDVYDMPRWAVTGIKFVSGQKDTAGRAVMGGDRGFFFPKAEYTIQQTILSVYRCCDSLNVEGSYADWESVPGYNQVKIVFTAGGDCTFGRDSGSPYANSFDQMYDTVNDPGYFFQNLTEFKQDDISMVNFEGTLTKATKPQNKTFTFKGDPKYAQILKAGSVEVVTVANNHSKDFFQVGFDDTLKNLAPYVTISGYDRKPIVEAKGVKVGFVSNTGWSFDETQKKYIRNSVKELRDQGAEIIIFTYHWGEERKYKSNATQKAIAHYCIDQGADLVIGHHPHVVQEVETYKGKQIAYSLGNLVFGGNRNPGDKNCLIFQQTFTLDLNSREVIETEYKAIPYKVSSVSYRNNYQPTPS